jgi:hypothetical protein
MSGEFSLAKSSHVANLLNRGAGLNSRSEKSIAELAEIIGGCRRITAQPRMFYACKRVAELLDADDSPSLHDAPLRPSSKPWKDYPNRHYVDFGTPSINSPARGRLLPHSASR